MAILDPANAREYLQKEQEAMARIKATGYAMGTDGVTPIYFPHLLEATAAGEATKVGAAAGAQTSGSINAALDIPGSEAARQRVADQIKNLTSLIDYYTAPENNTKIDPGTLMEYIRRRDELLLKQGRTKASGGRVGYAGGGGTDAVPDTVATVATVDAGGVQGEQLPGEPVRLAQADLNRPLPVPPASAYAPQQPPQGESPKPGTIEYLERYVSTPGVSNEKRMELQRQLELLREQAKQTGRTTRGSGEVTATPGAAETQQREEYQKQNTDWHKGQSEAALYRKNQMQNLDVMRDVLEKYRSGEYAEEQAALVGRLRTFFGDVPGTAQASPENFQTLMKSSVAQMQEQMKAIGGQPLVGEMDRILSGLPEPNKQPIANRNMLALLRASNRLMDKYTADFNKVYSGDPASGIPGNPRIDRAGWTQNWLAHNSLSDLYEKEKKSLAMRGATPPTSRMHEFDKGQHYIFEPGVWPNDKGPSADQPGKFRYDGLDPDTGEVIWQRIKPDKKK